MNVEWMLFCDYAFVDSNQKTCLIGIFDRIFANQVPAMHPQMAIAAKVTGEAEEEARLTVEIMRPSSALLARLEGHVKLGESKTAELRLGIVNLNLPDYGEYTVKLAFDGRTAKALSFSVQTAPQPAPIQ